MSRFLVELFSGRGFEGESERRTAVYNLVHEDKGYELTCKSPAEIGLYEKFIDHLPLR